MTVNPMGDGTFIIPLLMDQVDLSSIRASKDMYLSTYTISTVRKGGDAYAGNVIGITDTTATIDTGGRRITVRDYDNIVSLRCIRGKMRDGTIPSEITISYVSTGIQSSIVHSLDMESSTMSTDILISNDTLQDLRDTSIDVITSDRASISNGPTERMYAASSMEESSIGAVYSIDGQYTLVHGYTTTIDLIASKVNVIPMYVIDAPNGRANATYVVRWAPDVDIPTGSLYLYNGDVLEGTGHVPITGANQSRDISIASVPSIYAEGIIRTDADDAIYLSGTVYNTMSATNTVILRYYVGTGYRAYPPMRKEGPYFILPMTIEGGRSMAYQMKMIK